MKLERHWCMPNANTFSMKPVSDLLDEILGEEPAEGWLDPFARTAKRASITNDLNPDYDTTYNMEALELALLLAERHDFFNGILYDPPYSPRQVSACYQGVGSKTTAHDTSSGWGERMKDALADLVAPGGLVISFGWNSGGFGMCRGFHIERIILLAHGGAHNDTIITVERKVND